MFVCNSKIKRQNVWNNGAILSLIFDPPFNSCYCSKSQYAALQQGGSLACYITHHIASQNDYEENKNNARAYGAFARSIREEARSLHRSYTIDMVSTDE